MKVELLITGIGELCRMGEGSGPQAGPAQADTGTLKNAALAVNQGKVVAVGPRDEVAAAVDAHTVVDVDGRVVIPGWVDAHTHLLFARSREDEFAMRIQGMTYQEIAAQGGGIHSSVRHFRETSDEEILRRARRNLDIALSLGTTTMEIKSGYGLSAEQELRALRLIRQLAGEHTVRIVPTFLGAHEIPRDRVGDRDGYLREITDDMIPAVASEKLAEFCDVFCEEGVYTAEESRRVLEAARDHGLALKLHADEFGDTGGARLAAELGAVSADHLHGTLPEVAEAMAKAGVVGVLLPGTSFFLNLPEKASARRMVEAGLPLAVATDANPGSSMTQSMPLMVSLACIQLRLLPDEALVAATVNGAAAVSRSAVLGRLRAGFAADFQVLDLENRAQIPYHYGVSHVHAVYAGGRRVAGPAVSV